MEQSENHQQTQYVVAGPSSWVNYQAYTQGTPRTGAEEFGLYSDTHFNGQLTSGIEPYRFYNTMPTLGFADGLAECIVLRVDLHLAQHEMPDLARTDVSHWHGGAIDDELAALLCLATGRRLRSGGLVRVFVEGQDPAGHPIRWHHRAPSPPRPGPRRILVRSIEDASLGPARELVAQVSRISNDAAIALIRAARSYADALWVGDSDPATSWLGFVSALETAADYWYRAPMDAVEALGIAKPRIKELLQDGNPEILEGVADELLGITGATAKFLKFVLAHLPSPPEDRPPADWQVDWTQTQLRKGLNVIYAHRSKALHSGIPLPGPMCVPPDEVADKVYAERPRGPIAIADSVWTDRDLPMCLHTFEYIVRGALNSWWSQLSQD